MLLVQDLGRPTVQDLLRRDIEGDEILARRRAAKAEADDKSELEEPQDPQ